MLNKLSRILFFYNLSENHIVQGGSRHNNHRFVPCQLLIKFVLVTVLLCGGSFCLSAVDNTADLSEAIRNEASSSAKNNKLTIEYNVIGEFDILPLIVSKDFFAFSLGGNVGFGVRFNERYLVGLSFGAAYYTLGALPSSMLNGAELVFRWTIYGATRFTEWFSLYYGLGVSLGFSSYGISYTGYKPATSVGPTFHIEPRFYIPQCRYVDFALIADADLRIGKYFTPTVYGAGRVNVHPYITWLSLFAEVGGRYEGYQNDSLRVDLGQFVLSAGVSLDLFIGHKDRSGHSTVKSDKPQRMESDKPASVDDDTNRDILPNENADNDKPTDDVGHGESHSNESGKEVESKQTEPAKPAETKKESKPDRKEQEPVSEKEPENVEKSAESEPTAADKTKLVSEMDDETKAQYQELIEELEQQTGAKVVSFSDVLFEPNSDKMLAGSEAILDGVVAMLLENESMRLNLCGYTNNVGNKRQELRLSKNRVNKVVNYLVSKGIKMTRLEVAAYGGENVKRAGITMENRRVEIRVLEDKE